MRIRTALADEREILSRIEAAAGVLFADNGMEEVSRFERDPASLAPFQEAGNAWVAEVGGEPVGFVLAEPVDGCLHIEQVSVSPAYGRRGIGRALLDHVAAQAARRGYPALTLTTFTQVRWNGPFYARCGYRMLAPEEESPGLRRIRARETSLGLDRWPRCCMRKELRAPA